jgi:hypothetical protein
MNKIKRNVGVVEQVRIALRPEFRLATFVGVLLGAIVPLVTFAVAHSELDPWCADPLWLLVLGGLLFSARTVYVWGCLALGSPVKAAGFTVLIEGAMVLSSQEWLSITALVYLCGINAIATGVTLARGEPKTGEPAAPVPAVKRGKK